jgi:hypothetical protein
MKAVSDRGVSGREDVAGMAYRFNERIELNKKGRGQKAGGSVGILFSPSARDR